jgi:hypothetical protein
MIYDHGSQDKMRIMKPVCTFFAFAFLAFSAKPPDIPEVQAQLLDRNEYACANCFFGASTYYFCFEADNKVLIGYEKIPTMNWIDPDKNWLTKVHKSWQPNQTSDGQTVPLRYDQKHIWLTGPTGKQLRLTQDYTTDIFINNQQCRAAVKKK